MAKWWQHEPHEDTIERLASVSQQLEEVTQQVRDRLSLSPDSVLWMDESRRRDQE